MYKISLSQPRLVRGYPLQQVKQDDTADDEQKLEAFGQPLPRRLAVVLGQ